MSEETEEYVETIDIQHNDKIISLAWTCAGICQVEADRGAWTDYDAGYIAAAESILEQIQAINLGNFTWEEVPK